MYNCNKCIWSTRDGGCVSWKCDFVSHDDARRMIVEKGRKGARTNEQIQADY